VYKFSEKSTSSKFDQCYRQKSEHLQISINISTIIFSVYLFNIVGIDIFCGHTRNDRIRNGVIDDNRVGVAPIVEKVVQHRLSWFAYI
jgi:hypothetical protein